MIDASTDLTAWLTRQWPWLPIAVMSAQLIRSTITHAGEFIGLIDRARLLRRRRPSANAPRPLSTRARRAIMLNALWAGICASLINFQFTRIHAADLLRRRTIAIVQNEATPHIELAASAFATALHDRLGDATRIVIKTGSARATDDAINQNAFESVLRDLGTDSPDLLVTVGTAVSAYAAAHYPRLPRFFLVVTDPFDPANGIATPSERLSRASNVCGYGAGIHLDRMAQMLRDCFPGKRLGFITTDDYAQDRLVKQYMADHLEVVRFIEGDSKNLVLSPDSVRDIDLVFGWNFLNVHVAELVDRNPHVAFLGPQSLNFGSPVVACYGANYADLSREAANYVVDNYLLRHGGSLSSLPILTPDAAYLRCDPIELKKKGLTVGERCRCQ